jgi:hypothetical protein
MKSQGLYLTLAVGVLVTLSCSQLKPQKPINTEVPILEGAEVTKHYEQMIKKLKEKSIGHTTNQRKTKKVYFENLYQQLIVFGRLTGSKNLVQSCPKFHNDFLEINQQLKIEESVFKAVKNDKVDQIIRWLQQEVERICEFGHSDDYYVFANTLKYLNPKIYKGYNKEIIIVLMKLPVFSNYYTLANMMKPNRGIASTESKDLLNPYFLWLDSYISLVNVGQQKKL